jgi:hypothetical protein
MYSPVVGERVRVLGCRGDFIIARADYAACVAEIVAASSEGASQKDIPFGSLIEDDRGALLEGVRLRPSVIGCLRASWQCVNDAHATIREAHETIRATVATVKRTEALIAESDRFIARAQTLGC